MNKQRYRIVFNQARGLLMAVAEHVKPRSKANATAKGTGHSSSIPVTAGISPLRLAVLLATSTAAILPLSAYPAGIAADPTAPAGQQPHVGQTASGIPLVNITTPSAAGVSRNTYSQFNVDRQGAILNNSRTNAQTQIGGWVQGNPNLAAGAARVILNEVNSSNPSLLNGYVEIAGNRAQLVIANPAGISCDGCGFINAHRTTLTTGTPILQGGNLLGYRVGGGTISFLGNGLDARDANYTDVIARAVEVNAGLWASQLNVIAGTNQVDIDGSGNATNITPIAADAGSTAPAFSIDVAALGGMYAGKIRLVGTETGLGVRNAGTIGAEPGNVTITVQGRLVNSGAMVANGNMTLAAGDVHNSGELLANGALTLTSDGLLGNQGKIQTGQNLVLAALDLDNATTGEIGGLNTRVDIGQTLTNRGLVDGTDVFIAADTLNNTGTGRIYGDHLALTVDNLDNAAETIGSVTTAGTLAARDRLDLAVGQLTNRDSALIFSAGDMAIGGSLDANHQATDQAGDLLNSSAAIEAMGSLIISADSLVNERSAFSISRIRSDELPEGLAMLAYNPALQFYWPYEETSPVNWRNFVRDRYIGSISSLLGGLDRAYRNELVSLVNALPESVYRQSYNVWTRLLDKINVEHPEYIATMAAALSHQSFPLKTYRQYCDDSECDYVDYVVRQRTDYKDVVTSDAPQAALLAGDNATLAIDSLANRYSSIETGGDLSLTGSTLANTGADLFKVTSTITHTNRIHWTDRDHGTTTRSSTSSTLIGSTPAIISAGGSLTGSYTDRIDNITIRQNTAPLANATGTVPAAPSLDPIRNSSLYHPVSDPTASYLIETDPRFADYHTWLSSDYMLQQLNFDPAMTQQRLGDGFYEQRLLREQIAQLTGRRFLDGYADDEAQYRALMNNALTQMDGLTLVPGVALTAAQVAQLTSDIVWLVAQNVPLPDGTLTQALVPQVYVRPRAGDLSPGGALLAGQEVYLEVTGNPADGAGILTTSGTVAGRELVELNAANIDDVRGLIHGEQVKLTAAQDINIEGGSVAAGQSLVAHAGRDLTVQSSTSKQHVELQGTTTYVNSRTIDRVAGLYLSDDNAILVASAGRDVNLMAAAIRNSGADTDSTGGSALVAERNLNLGTVTETMRSYAKGMNSWRKEKATSSVGSAIDTQGDVTLLANHDLTAQAANVTSESGAITAAAGDDITISTGASTFESDAYRKIKKSSGFGSSKKEYRDSIDETTHTGSTFSGKTVALQAGLNGQGNVAIEGSNVVSTNGTNIEASGDVSIISVADVHDETHRFKKKSSGFGASGASLSYGSSKLKMNQQSHAVTQQKSTVGSVAGDVKIQAGRIYTQTGSDVLAPQGNIDITAEAVDIEASRNIYSEKTETEFKRSGITFSVRGGLVGIAQNVIDTSKKIAKSDSDRNKTLYALQTYANGTLLHEQGAATIDAIKSGDIEKAAANSGIRVSIGIGGSSMKSSSSHSAATHQSSLVKSGGDVRIKATDGNLAVKGSHIAADQNLTLDATKNINLLASADIESNRSRNKSSSMNVGVSMGTGMDGLGLSLDVAASRGKGMANSDSITFNNTTVSAGEKLNLQSGQDTNLIGANAKGRQVTADVQGNLNIQSLQDTASSHAKQSNTGISVRVPVASLGLNDGFGGISLSKQDNSSNYASVYQQSAIEASEEGFDIQVTGNTHLEGAVIGSTAVADKNRLMTGTLTFNDIDNHMNAEASTSGVTLSSEMLTSKYAALKGAANNRMNHGEAGVGDKSITLSAVSPAEISITDNTAQMELTGDRAEDSIAALNRDTTDTNRVLARPDTSIMQKKVQQEQTDRLLLATTISTFTDESFRKMFLSKAKLFEVGRDENGKVILDSDGKTIMNELSEDEKLSLKANGDNEKLNIYNNGIFNDETAAGKYSVQMAEAPADEKVYLLYFPEANNFFSELVIAAYQKSLEGVALGMTNTSKELIALAQKYGSDGLNLIGHSRGALTIGNALKALEAMELQDPLSDTHIKFVGPAYPAQEAANSLDRLSGGKQTTILLQNHAADFVGRLIGGNPATYGESYEENGLIKEWIKMFGASPTVHNCYGGANQACDDAYGEAISINVPSSVH